jgi:hypothetical protein
MPDEVRPVPGLDELFGSLKLNRPVASIREEKRAARRAIVREAGVREAGSEGAKRRRNRSPGR